MITPFFGIGLLTLPEHCYPWKPELVGLQILSDALIALAYYSIPLTLFYLVQKRRDLPFTWVLLFSVFAAACGTVQLIEIWTLWHPTYELSEGIELLTAIVSVSTAVLLASLIPKALALSSPAQVEFAQALQREVGQRLQTEAALQQSKSRYRAIVEDQTDLICRFLPDGTLTFVNTAYCQYFEKSSEELIQHSYLPAILEEELVKTQGQLDTLSQENPVATIINEVIRPNGVRTQQWNVRAMFTHLGQVTEFQAVGRDITEFKQAEQALRESENRFQAFMNNSPAASWITDGAGRVLYLSQTYFRLFKISENAIGKTVFELFPPDIAEQFYRDIRQVAETNQTLEAIEITPRSDGTIGNFLVYKFPINDPSGQCAVGGVAFDITEREQVKEQLRSLNARLQYLLAHAPVMIFSCKADGDYGATSVSENIKTILGYEPSEFLSNFGFWVNHIHPQDRDRVLTTASQLFVMGQHAHEYRFLHADGDYRWVYNQLHLMRDQAGNPTEIIGYLIDISDRKQAETAVQQSEVRYRGIVDDQTELIVRYGLDGNLTFVNDAFCRYFGMEREDAIGQSYDFCIFSEDSKRVAHKIQSMGLKDPTVMIENRVIALGEIRWMQWVNRALFDKQRNLIEFQAVGRDIHDLKLAEELVRQSEAKNRAMLATLPDLLLRVKRDGSCLDFIPPADPRAGTFIPIDKHLSEVLPPDLLEYQLQRLEQALATGELQVWEHQLLKGGRLCDEEIRLMPYREDEVLIIVRDISARKQIEKQLELQAIIVRTMAEGICLIRAADGVIIYANPKFERMFGYSSNELAGKHVSILSYGDENQEVICRVLGKIMAHGEATYEVHNAKKDGTSFWCQVTTSIVGHSEYGAVLVSVQQDITDRKQAENFIRTSLKEKEVLLKEIHHRVKNNLGIVDSLLQMQSRRSQNQQVVETLKESQNRIASIALVHEKLYHSKDLANIDFAQYISDLTVYLFDSYNIRSNSIKLTTDIDNISLDIDTAIPCGLIINELVSNALKYAFPGDRTGEVQVKFHQNQNRTLSLIVRDNGIGLPQDFNLKQTKTLGILLIQGLIKQLQATLEIDNEPGTTFKITFTKS